MFDRLGKVDLRVSFGLGPSLRKLVASKTFRSVSAVLIFLILGHTFGTHYLRLWGLRQLVGGLYISSLSPTDTYATVDWDELVYFPRALAVASGHSPLDPWVYHEHEAASWGPFPIVPPFIFGVLTRLAGDLHIALYWAVIISTAFHGWVLTLFFRRNPFSLGFFEAVLASLWFIKFPWFGVRFYQFSRFMVPSDYTLRAFLWDSPKDAYLDVEAGLFTYFPYVAFLVLFWRLMLHRNNGISTGLLAGMLTYVYFYHQIYAFLLLTTGAVVSLAMDGWKKSKSYVVALLSALTVAAPHYIQLWILRNHIDLLEYVRRLGFEEGRFNIENVLYLWYLSGPLLVGAIYWILRRPGETKLLCLRMFGVMVISYVMVLTIRLFLGFDINSDHYWRQSLGLPATLWMIGVTADLAKDLADRVGVPYWTRGFAAGGIVTVMLVRALATHWGSWDQKYYERKAESVRSHITWGQQNIVKRMKLLEDIVHPGEVLLVTDPVTAYHARVNLDVRLLVPSGMSVLSNREIMERYFVAQYFSGSSEIRGPRDSGNPREPDKFVQAAGEHLFLLVNYNRDDKGDYGLGEELAQMIANTSIEEAEKIYARRLWRVDAVFGRTAQREVALERMRKYFRVLEVHNEDGYWVASVEPL